MEIGGVVADEFGGFLVWGIFGDGDGGFFLGGAGAFALFVHGLIEAVEVDGHVAFAGDELGEVDGEAVGIVEGEGVLAGDGFRFGGDFVEELEAAVDGAFEGFFFVFDDFVDEVALGDEFWEEVAHFFDDGVDELGEEAWFEVEVFAPEDGTAEDAAEDVVAAFVAWEDAVGYGE